MLTAGCDEEMGNRMFENYMDMTSKTESEVQEVYRGHDVCFDIFHLHQAIHLACRV